MRFTDLAADVVATRFSGGNTPIIIITDSCNLSLHGIPVKPEKESSICRLSPNVALATKNDSVVNSDQNDDADSNQGELAPPPPLPSLITPTLKRHFNENCSMNNKQVFDCLINSGDYARMKDRFGEETDSKVKTALYQMKADGFLSRADGKKNTPWIASEKLYSLFKGSNDLKSESGLALDDGEKS
jgi:hypothetical protein